LCELRRGFDTYEGLNFVRLLSGRNEGQLPHAGRELRERIRILAGQLRVDISQCDASPETRHDNPVPPVSCLIQIGEEQERASVRRSIVL
jgi:hypothetical protein